MKEMNQKEIIRAYKAKSKATSEIVKKIQAAYETYMNGRSEKQFDEMLKLLEKYCFPVALKYLDIAGCRSRDNEDTVIQNARMTLWSYIQNDIRQGRIRYDFAYYACGIYKNRTIDFTRKIIKERTNLNEVSLDEPVGDDGKTVADILPPDTPNFDETAEIQRMFKDILRLYITSFLTSKEFPPKPLALYYARVLPHLIGALSSKTMSSAKWAFERMNSFSVSELKQDSEKTIRSDIDKNLRWGPEFVSRLDEMVDIGDKLIPLRDVIYTSQYGVKTIENWAKSMHEMSSKTLTKLIMADRELFGLTKSYATYSAKFIGYNGGESR